MKKLKTVEDVGKRTREIRLEQGVSQETLAGLAGTGQRYISEFNFLLGNGDAHGKNFSILGGELRDSQWGFKRPSVGN